MSFIISDPIRITEDRMAAAAAIRFFICLE